MHFRFIRICTCKSGIIIAKTIFSFKKDEMEEDIFFGYICQWKEKDF